MLKTLLELIEHHREDDHQAGDNLFPESLDAKQHESIGKDADDKGAFVIRNIAAGEYSLVARRDGYLENSVSSRSGLRMPRTFTLGAGLTLTDITFRLRPWGVLSGKIRPERLELLPSPGHKHEIVAVAGK